MQRIVLIGYGNVGIHLYKAFKNSAFAKIIQVYNHRAESLQELAEEMDTTTSLAELKAADIYIVSIPDSVTEQTVNKLAGYHSLVVHTAGSIPLLHSNTGNGVFYPLQTFSKNTPLDFSKVPLCIEADSAENLELLRKLAESITSKVYEVSTEQRKSLHLSAVFACNFTNHLYSLAEAICDKNKLPFEILHPLIQETARKIEFDSPKNSQTGPAIRNDAKTIAFHLKQLDSPELKEIYTLLTKSIQDRNGY